MPRQPRKLSDDEEHALAAATVPQPCPVYCVTHERGCNITGEHYTANGQSLHACSYGQWGHNWWEKL